MTAPALSPAEYETVKRFGMHRRVLLNEDTRAGFAILAAVVGVIAFVVIIAVVVGGLIWYGVTHL